MSNLGNILTSNCINTTGIQNQGVAGYFAGGSAGATYFTRFDKIAFPSDTKSTISAVLATGAEGRGGMSDSGVAWYSVGGIISGASTLDTVEKLTFATTEVCTTLGTVLTVARRWVANFSDEGVF